MRPCPWRILAPRPSGIEQAMQISVNPAPSEIPGSEAKVPRKTLRDPLVTPHKEERQRATISMSLWPGNDLIDLIACRRIVCGSVDDAGAET
jgi:hypothetical protein